jgi:hypothetical protein
MHHSLRIYSRHRELTIRLYMLGASYTRVPLVGRLVRWVANAYGRNTEGAYLLSPAEAGEVVDIAEGVAVGPCTCREVYRNCDNPVNVEILLGPSRSIFLEAMPHDSHEISKEEAREILRDCHRRGLIHAIIQCKGEYYAICNCCPCCCVPLRMKNKYGIGDALMRHPDIVSEFRASQHAHA